jgi:hypothetical protein
MSNQPAFTCKQIRKVVARVKSKLKRRPIATANRTKVSAMNRTELTYRGLITVELPDGTKLDYMPIVPFTSAQVEVVMALTLALKALQIDPHRTVPDQEN